ncbi:MAG TPA: hypothetical protein DEP42_05785 [Ruminococcaceae bacterium]|nr:hypothetical protein [Oscillospiraceae bacterium]
MSEPLKWLLRIAISVFLLAYVGIQAYRVFYHSVRSQHVTLTTVSDSVTVNSIALQENKLITKSDSGVVDYLRTNGEHVSQDGTVANVYATAQDAQNAETVQALQTKVSNLQNIGSSNTAGATDISVLNTALQESYLKLAQTTDSSDLEGLTDARDDLLNYMNHKQLATGSVTDFNSQITTLQNKVSTLQSQIKSSAKAITAPATGTFVSSVDGYENAYDISKIQSIQPTDVEKLLKENPTPEKDAIGKIVPSFQWYVVALVNANQAQKLSVHSQVDLRFLLSSEDAVPATVLSVNAAKGKYAAVFTCSNMTKNLATIRKQNVQIQLAQYTGLQIANQYIHVVNGKKGVYILDGNAARFRTISPSYSGNGYTISAVDTTDTKRLQVDDSIIVNRDDLHDGQLLQ